MIALLAIATVLTMPASWKVVDVPNPPGSTVEVLLYARGPLVKGFEQTMNVIRKRYSDDAMSIDDWATAATNDLQSRDGVKILASHKETLCDKDGWIVESTGTYNGHRLDLQQEAILDGGWEYVATYSRAAGSDADADAEKALTTLCPL